MIEVAAFSSDERVRDAQAVAATHDFFREMGADESSAAGDQVR
jgi:hypothetical protein